MPLMHVVPEPKDRIRYAMPRSGPPPFESSAAIVTREGR